MLSTDRSVSEATLDLTGSTRSNLTPIRSVVTNAIFADPQLARSLRHTADLLPIGYLLFAQQSQPFHTQDGG